MYMGRQRSEWRQTAALRSDMRRSQGNWPPSELRQEAVDPTYIPSDGDGGFDIYKAISQT